MANSSKQKGDRGERDAVAFLAAIAPELVSAKKAQRKLGAGRMDDEGDLDVYNDVAIQVRNLKASDLGLAVRSSATDSVLQAANGFKDHALGMVPIHGARQGTVRWLACVAPGRWPVHVEPVMNFGIVSKAATWLRDDKGPLGYRPWARDERICLLEGPGAHTLVAPMEAWLAAYAQSLGAPSRQFELATAA